MVYGTQCINLLVDYTNPDSNWFNVNQFTMCKWGYKCLEVAILEQPEISEWHTNM